MSNPVSNAELIASLYEEISSYLMAASIALPRMTAMFLLLPIFNRQQFPNMLRMVLALGFAMLIAPMVLPSIHAGVAPVGGWWAVIIFKEFLIGFVMSYLLSIPFWAFEGVGTLIDNQRGASTADTINPQTGDDTSPLGLLLTLAYIVFFFLSGGFNLMLGMMYDSYQLWSPLSWMPRLDYATIPLLLSQLDRLVSIMLLLSAPVLIAMFLADLGLGFASRFAPQLQVYFLAMPIKSGLAFLVLMLYTASLFEYGQDYIRSINDVLPLLRSWWEQ